MRNCCVVAMTHSSVVFYPTIEQHLLPSFGQPPGTASGPLGTVRWGVGHPDRGHEEDQDKGDNIRGEAAEGKKTKGLANGVGRYASIRKTSRLGSCHLGICYVWGHVRRHRLRRYFGSARDSPGNR